MAEPSKLLPAPGSFDYWVSSCRSDLARLADDLRWALSAGYWPAGRWIDAERGVDLSQDEERKLQRAARHDVGIGDYPCRLALEHATKLLAYADVHLAAAVHRAGTRSAQPAFVRPDHHRTLDRVLLAIRVCTMRLDVLVEDQGFVNRKLERAITRELGAAGKNLEMAVNGLARALNRGRARPVDEVRWCAVCKIRPTRAANRKDCNTCHAWSVTHKGQKRPRKLDAGENDAKAAAKRRRDRGETPGGTIGVLAGRASHQ